MYYQTSRNEPFLAILSRFFKREDKISTDTFIEIAMFKWGLHREKKNIFGNNVGNNVRNLFKVDNQYIRTTSVMTGFKP